MLCRRIQSCNCVVVELGALVVNFSLFLEHFLYDDNVVIFSEFWSRGGG